ncbi:MAG: hypothetical protein LBK71_02355 [Verrucomicrobiales bacterium]|jgi:hypothetical protein|nr:hypothetical protein [Verrucomicrobiales bacterium]
MSTALQHINAFLNGQASRLLSVCHEPVYRQVPDEEEFITKACAVLRRDAAADGDDSVLPVLGPDFGTISTAAIYGGKRIPASRGGMIHIEPVAATVTDLLSLTAQPLPYEQTDFARAARLYHQVRARLELDELYVRTPDFQGPLNTLALLLADQGELIAGLYEEPETVRAVALRVTDTLIEYVARYRDEIGPERVVGNIWPFVTLTGGRGVGITQDYMPLLGPDLYAEFELPLLKKIADRFGGVYVHCCGVYGQHLRNLAASGVNLLGLESCYPETPAEQIYEVFGDRVAITPGVGPLGQQEFPTLVALVRSWRGKPVAKARFWFCFCHEWGDVADLRRAVAELG